MGSKKKAKRSKAMGAKKYSKGIHKDLYVESPHEPETVGLWDRVEEIVASSPKYQSKSQFTRAALLLLAKLEEKEIKNVDGFTFEHDLETDRVEVSQHGKTFKVWINKLHQDEAVEIKASRWGRKDGKVVKALGGFRIEPDGHKLIGSIERKGNAKLAKKKTKKG